MNELKPLPSDEEIFRVSIEQNEDDISDQIIWRIGAKWTRSQCPDVAKLSADLEVMREAWREIHKALVSGEPLGKREIFNKADAIAKEEGK
mgnify:FL=1